MTFVSSRNHSMVSEQTPGDDICHYLSVTPCAVGTWCPHYRAWGSGTDTDMSMVLWYMCDWVILGIVHLLLVFSWIFLQFLLTLSRIMRFIIRVPGQGLLITSYVPLQREVTITHRAVVVIGPPNCLNITWMKYVAWATWVLIMGFR